MRLPSLHSVQLLVSGLKIYISNLIQVTDYSGSSETLILSLLTQFLKNLNLIKETLVFKTKNYTQKKLNFL